MSFNLKEFSYQSFFYTLGDILNKASKFLLIPLYTRVFTQVEYGILEQIIIITAIIDIFLSFACKTTLLKLFYDFKSQNKEKRIVWIMFFLILAMGFFFVFLANILNLFNLTTFGGHDYYPYLFYIVGYSFFLNLGSLSLILLRVQKRIFLYTCFNLLQTLVELFFIIIFVVFFKLGVMGKVQGAFFALLIFSVITSVFILWRNFPLRFSKLRLNFPFQSLRSDIVQTIKFAFPLVLNNILGWLLVSFNKILINIHFGLKDLALFTLGSQLVTVYKLAMEGLLKAYNVILYEKFDYLKKYYKDFFFVFTCIFCFTGGIVTLFGKEIIAVIATAVYTESSFVVSLLVFSRFLMLLTVILYFPLYYFKANLFIFKASLVGVFITIIGGLWLIPKFHFLGACLSMTLVYAAMLILLFWKVSKYLENVFLWRNIAAIFSFCVLIGLSFLSFNFIVRILVLCLYGVFLLLLSKKQVKYFIKNWK